MDMSACPKPEPAFNATLTAAVCICGPGLVTLVPLAAAPALTAMATAFYPKGGGAFFAQMVMTMPAAAMVLAAPIIGYCAERFGRRNVLLVSLVVYLIGGAGALVAPSAPALIASRLLLGIAGAGVLTSCLTLIGQYFEGRFREKVLGLGVALSSFVGATALSGGGSLVDAFGWRGPFALYLLATPVVAAVYFVIRPPSAVAQAELQEEEAPVSWGPLWQISPYFLVLMIFTLGMFTPSIQGPFLLQADGITSAAAQGSIVAACSIMAIFSSGFYGFLRSRISLHNMIFLTASSFASGLLLLSVLHGIWTVIGSAIVGIGAGVAEATVASSILMRAPTSVHGRALGLMVSSLFLGQWFNPLVFAPLRSAFGIRGSLLAVGTAFMILSAGLALNRLTREERATPGQLPLD